MPSDRDGRRVHRLTDRNNAGGIIDQCLTKTVFVNNLLISVDGSLGTLHGNCLILVDFGEGGHTGDGGGGDSGGGGDGGGSGEASFRVGRNRRFRPSDDSGGGGGGGGGGTDGGTDGGDPVTDDRRSESPLCCYHVWTTNQGSRNVFAEFIPVNFEGNLDTCLHWRIDGSPDVFVGELSSLNASFDQDRPLGSDRPARNTKEANKGSGNASPSNVACRQRDSDRNAIENKPADNDPNKDGPQRNVDADDPNKLVDAKPGVTGGGQASNEQASRDRLRAQMEQDYANRDQWQGGKRSPAGNAAFGNIGYGNAANGTAWCAAYVNSNLKDSGAGYAASVQAASSKAYKPVDTGQAKPGDVLVFDGGRHTALVYDVKPNGDIILQGGNQGGGEGAVTRNTITAASGYQYGTQRLSSVHNPHDQEYNRNNNLNIIPNERNNAGYSHGSTSTANNKLPGKDCPEGSPGEKAANEGRGIRTDVAGAIPRNAASSGVSSLAIGLSVEHTLIIGRIPDATYPSPSSMLSGGNKYLPLINLQGGPYSSPDQIDSDPIKEAHDNFIEKLAVDSGPIISEISTYDHAIQLAIAATGKTYPSGLNISVQLPLAQRTWWNSMYAVNQHRQRLAEESFNEVGITSYRPASAETITKMMAHHSAWGNSAGNIHSPSMLKNPLGLGWNGKTWYVYATLLIGITAISEFINFGKDGSRGRYMIPSGLERTSDDELDYIYKQGFTDGRTPLAVKLIKAPD